jgi:hypothetical protein
MRQSRAISSARLFTVAAIVLLAVALAASLAGAVAINHAVNGVVVTAKSGFAGVESQAYVPPWLQDLWRLRDIFMKDYNRVHLAYAKAVPEGAWTGAEDPADLASPSNDAKEKLYDGTQERAYLDLASRFESRLGRDIARSLQRNGPAVTEAGISDLRESIVRAFSYGDATQGVGFSERAFERAADLIVAPLKPGMKAAEAERLLDQMELSAFRSTDGNVLGIIVYDKQTGDTHAAFDVKSAGKPGWGKVQETVAFDWQVDPKVGTYVDKSAAEPVLLAKAKVTE